MKGSIESVKIQVIDKIMKVNNDEILKENSNNNKNNCSNGNNGNNGNKYMKLNEKEQSYFLKNLEEEQIKKTLKEKENEGIKEIKGDNNDYENERKKLNFKSRFKRITISEVLDYSGFGLYQWFIFIVSGLGWIFDGIELALIGFILPGIKTDFHMSSFDEGLVGSVVFLGMGIGALVGGIVSDTFGRRFVYINSVLFTGIFAFLSSLSPNLFIFLFIRLFVGFFIGALVPNDYNVCIEVQPKKLRGVVGGMLSIFFVSGNILVCLLCWLFFQHSEIFHFHSISFRWRIVVIITSIPGIFISIIRFFLTYESPRYLLVKKKNLKAEKVLKRILQINSLIFNYDKNNDVYKFLLEKKKESHFSQINQNNDNNIINKNNNDEKKIYLLVKSNNRKKILKKRKSIDLFPSIHNTNIPKIGNKIQNNDIEKDDNENENNFKMMIKNIQKFIKKITPKSFDFFLIFSKPLFLTTISLCLIWFLISVGTWGFLYLVPILFEKVNSTKNKDWKYVETLIVYITGFFGQLFAALLIDLFPRKIFLFLSFIITGSCLFFTMLFTFLKMDLLVVIFSMGVNFTMAFSWCCLNVYSPEVFPSIIRNSGLGFVNVWTRLGGTVTPIIGTVLIEYSDYIPYMFFSISLVLCAFFSLTLPYETKGKPLKDGIKDFKNNKEKSLLHSFILIPFKISKKILKTEHPDDHLEVKSEV